MVEPDAGLLESEALGFEIHTLTFQVQVLLVQTEAGGLTAGTAEDLDVGDEGVDDLGAGFAAGLDGAKKVGEHEGGEVVVQSGGLGGIQLTHLLGKRPDLSQGTLLRDPIRKPALFPLVDALINDRTAGEELREHRLDFREGVEPGNERRGWFIVQEAMIELLADGQGEASNFANPGPKGRRAWNGRRSGFERGGLTGRDLGLKLLRKLAGRNFVHKRGWGFGI